jgi:polyisoprenyl-phosphate glycosyltransferase
LDTLGTLTVISPVYNEEAVVESFYHELKSQLDKLSGRYSSRILFVVDRSTDVTLRILKKIAQSDQSVQILALSSRFGHQMSLLAGIDHADSDAIIMMDCDLQHPPQVIPELLAAFEKGSDVVYTIRKDAEHTGLFKRASSRWFYRLINRISDIPINESAADFRLISRRVAIIFKEQLRERNMFLRGLISWVGFNQSAVSFTVGPRGGGISKYPLVRLLKFSREGVLSFSKKPLQAAIFVGVAFAGLGFIMAFVTFIQYCMKLVTPSGWTTLVILLSVFSGIQLIFLGIIGEYIGGIFDEVKKRPHYIVEEKVNLP